MPERSSIADAIRRGDHTKAAESLLRWMDKEPSNFQHVAHFADTQYQKGNYGLAVHLYKYCMKFWEDMTPEYRAIMWAQIGSSLWQEGFRDEAEFAFDEGLKLGTYDAAIYAVLCGNHLNNGTPEKAIEYGDKSLAINPAFPPALFNRGTAYLELGQWKEGWQGYRSGERSFGSRSYHEGTITPEWDGKRRETIVAWGEQGVGDEIMFATCLPEARKNCKEIILDCHPRLAKTFRRSFQGMTIYPTRKRRNILWHHQHQIDSQISLGNLPGFYRNSDAQFPGTPYLKADPARVEFYRGKLRALGMAPYVAVAWFGGEKRTRFDYRTIPLKLFKPIRDMGGTFVSVQYNKWGHRKEAAENKIPEWTGYYDSNGPIEDLDEMFALIEACDLVISVCQTAVHMAGAIGKECWCLTPEKPAWRYGVKGERMHWYNSVTLIRQGKDESWQEVIGRVAERYRLWKSQGETGRAQDFPAGGRKGIRGMETGASQSLAY